MKKSLLVSLILLSGIFLVACEKNEEVENDQPIDVVVETSDCQRAVQNYLAESDQQ
jgi:uncharacterized protein YcfL